MSSTIEGTSIDRPTDEMVALRSAPGAEARRSISKTVEQSADARGRLRGQQALTGDPALRFDPPLRLYSRQQRVLPAWMSQWR